MTETRTPRRAPSSESVQELERATELIETDVCSLCGGDFQFHDEEVTYEPHSTVYVCANHRDYTSGECPGTIITVYGDGHISRRVYGRGTVPLDP